ncbi:MAG: DUF2834 domain-containing protein [Bacteroidota bacterium]
MTPTPISSAQRTLLLVVTAAFTVLTVVAVVQHGYVGLLTYQFATSAGMQVLIDLVIACALFLVWLWHDAKALGRSPWPWIALTFVAGSFGPLLYLLTRKTTA